MAKTEGKPLQHFDSQSYSAIKKLASADSAIAKPLIESPQHYSTTGLDQPLAFPKLEEHIEKSMVANAKGNDHLGFWGNTENAISILGNQLWMNASGLMYAMTDIRDALPDPFSLDMNFIRRFFINTNAQNPMNWMATRFSPESRAMYDAYQEKLKTDEMSKKWNLSPDDNENVIPFVGGLTYGDLRERWKGDGKPNNWLAADALEGIRKSSENLEAYTMRTGSENADYWLNGGFNLLGSMGSNVIMGGAAGRLVGFMSKAKLPIVKNATMNAGLRKTEQALNSKVVQKAGQIGIAQGQTSSEAMIQAVQSSDREFLAATMNMGGEEFKNNLADYINQQKEQVKRANPENNPFMDASFNLTFERKATDHYIKEIWGKENPDLLKKAEQIRQTVFNGVVDFSAINMFLNYTSSGLYIKPFAKTRKLIKNPSMFTVKDYGREFISEAFEEETTAVADKYATAKGKGEDLSFNETVEKYFDKDVLEQGMWGALGGVGHTGFTHLTTSKKRMAEHRNMYKQQQEILQQFDEIGKISSSDELRKTMHLMTNNIELKQILANIEKLESEGKTDEAKNERSKILFNQAYTAFDFGLTKQLLDSYTSLSNNQNLTEEERAKATEAVGDIKALEKIYNETAEFLNHEEIFANRANIHTLNRSINQKEMEANKYRLHALTQANQFRNQKGENVDMGVDLEGAEIQHLPMVQNYRTIRNEIDLAKEKLADLETNDIKLSSYEAQRNQFEKNKFHKKVAIFAQLAKKQMIKSGRNPEDYYTSNTFKTSLKNLIESTEERGNIQDFTEMKHYYEGMLKVGEVYEKIQNQVKAEAINKSKNAPAVPKAIDDVPETVTPELQAANDELNSIVSNITPIEQKTPEQEELDKNSVTVEDTGILFMPKKVKELTDQQWNDFERVVGAYADAATTNGSKTFSSFVDKYISMNDKQSADDLYDLLKETWKRLHNKNQQKYDNPDFDKIYSEKFTSIESINKELNQLALDAVVTEDEKNFNDNRAGNEGEIANYDETTGEFTYNHDGRVLNYPGSTAAYTARKHRQINTVEGNEVNISHERIEDDFFTSRWSNPRPLANPDKFKIGTRLVAEIHPDALKVPYALKWKEGAKVGEDMILAEGQKPITFGDVLEGVDVKVVVETKSQTEEGNTVVKEEIVTKHFKIEEGSDEYWNQVPMIFYQEGKSIGEGSAFIHTPDYYNETSTASVENRAVAISETIKIRQIVKEKGKALLTVAHNSKGTFEKTRLAPDQLKSIADADPQALIAVMTEEGIKVVNEQGKLVSLATAGIELEGEDYKNKKLGTTFDLRRSNTAPDGKKAYVAMTYTSQAINPNEKQIQDIETSIYWAIQIYINQDNPNSTKTHKLRDEFKKQTQYDLHDIKHVRAYLALFIREIETHKSDDEFSIAASAERLNASLHANNKEIPETGMPYFSTHGSQLKFGITGVTFGSTKKMVNGEEQVIDNPMQVLHKASVLSTSAGVQAGINNLLNGKISIAKRLANFKMSRNVSFDGLNNAKNFGMINENGEVINTDMTYVTFLQQNTMTDVESVNVGTETEPLYTPFVQRTIGFKIGDKTEITAKEVSEFKKTGEISTDTKQNIAIKIAKGQKLSADESDMANVAFDIKEKAQEIKKEEAKKEEVKKEEAAPIETKPEPMVSPDDAEKLKSIEEDINKLLSPEERKTSNENLMPTTLSDEQRKAIAEQNQRIPYLLPHQQDDLIDVVVDHISEAIGFAEDAAIDTDVAHEKVTQFIMSKVTPMIAQTQVKINDLIAMLEKYPNNVEVKTKIETAILNLQNGLLKLQAVQSNMDIIISEAEVILKKERGIVEKVKKNELIDDDNKENEVNHSKTSLEENAKEQASYQIRRFLRTVKQYDKEGNPVTGFLGFAKSAPIDDTFDTLTVLLADTSPSFEKMMYILKNQGDAYPWLYHQIPDDASMEKKAELAEANKNTLVGMLESANTPQSVKNQFVHLMTKHALKMKFVMYSINKENGSYSLRVWDTNAMTAQRRIQQDWSSNFVDKLCLVDEETGEYYINPKRAEELLNEYKKFFGEEVSQGSVHQDVRSSIKEAINANYFSNFNKLKVGETITLDISHPSLAKTFEEKGEKVKNGMTFTLSKLGPANDSVGLVIKKTPIKGKYEVKVYQKTNFTLPQLQVWLANLGILTSMETLQELRDKGVFIKESGSKKATLKKINQMFSYTGKPDGVFGLLAKNLDLAIKANEQGKKFTFGVGNDFSLNEQYVRKLATLESRHSNVKNITSWRDNGKSIYGFTPSKFVTDKWNELKKFTEAGDTKMVNELIEDLRKSAFSQGALLLELMENEPDFVNKFEVAHMGVTALKEISKNVYQDSDITKLTDIDHEITKMGAFMDVTQGEVSDYEIKVGDRTKKIGRRMGMMFGLTMSDKTSMFLFKTAVFNLDAGHFDIQNGRVASMNEEVSELLYQQTVLPELRRMIEYFGNKGKYNFDTYNGGLFYLIPDLNKIMVRDMPILDFIEASQANGTSMEKIEEKIKPLIVEQLQKTVMNLAAKKRKIWSKSGFIAQTVNEKTGKSETNLSFFNNEYLKSMDVSNVDIQADIASLDFVINYLLHNAEMFKVFAGDPAQYYKSSKSSNPVAHVKATFSNINKRMALLNAPGNKLADSDDNQYIEMFIADSKVASSQMEMLERALGKEGAKAYLDITATDGQEYTTWQEHLYILEKMGRTPDIIMDVTPDDLAEARKIFANNNLKYDALTDRQKAIIKKVMQPIKPVYTGSEFDEQNQVMRTLYIKTSSFPLIPQLTDGLQIDDLRLLMEKVQDEKRMTVRATYYSGAKTGSIKEPMNVFGENGFRYVNGDKPLNQVTSDEVMNKHALVLKRKNFRIQQDVPYKAGKREEDITSMGTQMTKLILGGKVISLNDFDYQGVFDDNNEFKNLDRKVNGRELHKAYSQLYNELIMSKKRELYSELGLNINGKPKNLAETAKILGRILKDEAINRNYPIKDIQSLELNANNEFVIPIWLISNSDSLESLLMAIVEKRIAKIKFPGNSYVVGSEAGFKFKRLEELTKKERNRIAWVNPQSAIDGLKPNQILITPRFRSKDGKLINLIEMGYTKEQIVNGQTVHVLDKSKIDEKLLQLVSFRIPTSSHNSMSIDDIAGFLPEECGDLMIVSGDKTIQKGLDFDIDKENGYALWHTIDDAGRIVSLDRVTSLANYNAKMKKLKEELEIAKTSASDVEDMSEEAMEKLMAESDELVKGYLQEIRDLKAIYPKLLQNEIIKIQRAVLSHSQMQDEISKVLSIEYAKKEADFILELQETDDESFNPLSDQFQKEQMQLGASGRLGIGAYSLDVVGHSLFTQAAQLGNQLFLKSDNKDQERFSMTFGNVTSDGGLGNDRTLDGKRTISEVLAERQNIATDNVKAEVMGNVNLNKYTLDADKAMNMLGFDMGEDGHHIPFLFLKQPIVMEFVSEMEKVNSNSSTEFYNDKKQHVIDLLVEKYGTQDLFATLDNADYGSELNNSNLSKGIAGAVDNDFQLKILHRFLKLDKYGREIRTVQTTLNVDSKGIGISFFDAIEKINKLENLGRGMKLISNVDKLVGEFIDIEQSQEVTELEKNGYVIVDKFAIKPTTVAGSFAVHTLATANKLWSKYFPYQSERINEIFDEISAAKSGLTEDDDIEEDVAPSKLKVKEKQQVLSEIKKFIFSSEQLGIFSEDVQGERERLFFDRFTKDGTRATTSLCTYLKNYLNKPDVPDSIKRNRFIASLEFLPEKNGKISMIRFNNAAAESFDEDSIYRGFTDLITSDVKLEDFNGKPYSAYQLATDLITYAYLEGGIQQAAQFVKFVPISYLQEMPFAKELNKIHKLLTGRNKGVPLERVEYWNYNIFGLANPQQKKANPHLVSLMTMQYIQHNPEKAFKMTLEDLIKYQDKSGITAETKLEDIKEFAVKDAEPRTFISIYNEKIRLGKKFQLYKYDGVSKTYKRIPVYGAFGLSEYNRNSNVNTPYKSLLNDNSKVFTVTTEAEDEAPKLNTKPETNNIIEILNEYHDKKIDTKMIDRIIAEALKNPDIDKGTLKLLEGFRNKIAELGVNIFIGSIKNKNGVKLGEGIYMDDINTIAYDVNLLAKSSNKEIVHTIIHEMAHALTTIEVKKYLPTGIYTDGMSMKDMPMHIVQLINIFKEARKTLGEELISTIKTDKGLTAEQKPVYGGYDMFEFIAEILSNNDFRKKLNVPYKGSYKTIVQKFVEWMNKTLRAIGIEIPEGSITEQALLNIFKLVEADKYIRGTDVIGIMNELKKGDTISFEYISDNSDIESIRTVIFDRFEDGKLHGYDVDKKGERQFKYHKINVVTDFKPTTEQPNTVNIWFGTNENPILSNLNYRPFTYGGRKYHSVEHAFQSLKSGSFDQEVYDAYNKAFEGFEGRLTQQEYDEAYNTLVEQHDADILNVTVSRDSDIYSLLPTFPDNFRAKVIDGLVHISKKEGDEWVNASKEGMKLFTSEQLESIKRDKARIIDEANQKLASLNAEHEANLAELEKQKPLKNPGKIKSKKPADENATSLMENIIRQSMIENSDVKDALLATGNAEITHKQESSSWATEFPKILMKLREDFKSGNVSSSRIVKIDQYNITIDSEGKMWYGNGVEVTDDTVKNKVNLKLDTDPKRIVEFNNYKYYVFPDGKIVNYESGKEVFKEDSPSRNSLLAQLSTQLDTNRSLQEIKDENLVKEADKVLNNERPAILDKRKNQINYTEGQKEALVKIQGYLDRKITNAKDLFFLLAGYAGTGKTTIVENIVKYAQGKGMVVEVIAPTNKAASRLREKLGDTGADVEASTIHKVIYGEPNPITGEWEVRGMKPNAVYIIDESSMIEQSILNDLMVLAEMNRSKIIFIGDGFQLEPVGDDPKLFEWNHPKFSKENYSQLTEVKRQGIGTILSVATAMRNLHKAIFPKQSTNDFMLMQPSNFTQAFLDSVVNGEDSILITSTNKTRMEYNKRARLAKYGNNVANIINEGERLISVANSTAYANSELFSVDEFNVLETTTVDITTKNKGFATTKSVNITIGSVRIGKQWHTMVVAPDLDMPSLYGQQLAASYVNTKNKKLESIIYKDKQGKYKTKEDVIIATYGYAITAHKSQGSEWSKVYLESSWMSDSWDKARWLYTAVTRAKDTIVASTKTTATAMNLAEIEKAAGFADDNNNDKPETETTITNLMPVSQDQYDILSLVSEDELSQLSDTFVDATNQPIC